MGQSLVTLETDGLRDYVIFPSGERRTLGPISVLKFITSVCPRRGMREALDTYNAVGKTMVLADLDAMDRIFRREISFFASENPLMGTSDRTPISSDGDPMDEKTMMEHLGKIEGVVSTLRKYASMDGGLISPKHHDGLWALVGALHFTNPGDQSKNDAWYINGTPKVDTIDPGQKIPESITHAPAPSTTPVYAPGTKTASVAPVAPTVVPAVVPAATQEPVLPPSTPEPSFQNLKANTKLAEDTLSQVEQTLSKVDALVTAGRKFNASRAKSDLHRVAADVNEIISHVDLAQPWVRKDLQGLADRSAHLFGLFPAKV